MLVDFEPVVGDFEKPEELWEKVETGVFYTILNGEKLFFPGTNPDPEFDDYRNNYGVCDNADQIKRHYPEVVESDRKFVICMTPMLSIISLRRTVGVGRSGGNISGTSFRNVAICTMNLILMLFLCSRSLRLFDFLPFWGIRYVWC